MQYSNWRARDRLVEHRIESDLSLLEFSVIHTALTDPLMSVQSLNVSRKKAALLYMLDYQMFMHIRNISTIFICN
jgi:hypothetical protein